LFLIFQVDVADNVTIDDLLDIDNNVLSTILKIFATLNSEIFFLKNDVKVKLFNSILYYEECGKNNRIQFKCIHKTFIEYIINNILYT